MMKRKFLRIRPAGGMLHCILRNNHVRAFNPSILGLKPEVAYSPRCYDAICFDGLGSSSDFWTTFSDPNNISDNGIRQESGLSLGADVFSQQLRPLNLYGCCRDFTRLGTEDKAVFRLFLKGPINYYPWLVEHATAALRYLDDVIVKGVQVDKWAQLLYLGLDYSVLCMFDQYRFSNVPLPNEFAGLLLCPSSCNIDLVFNRFDNPGCLARAFMIMRIIQNLLDSNCDVEYSQEGNVAPFWNYLESQPGSSSSWMPDKVCAAMFKLSCEYELETFHAASHRIDRGMFHDLLLDLGSGNFIPDNNHWIFEYIEKNTEPRLLTAEGTHRGEFDLMLSYHIENIYYLMKIFSSISQQEATIELLRNCVLEYDYLS